MFNIKLRAEVYGETDLPEKPDMISGLERIDDKVRHVEINNTGFISNSSVSSEPIEKPKKNFFNKVGNFFEKTANKIKDMKIGEKTKKFAKSTTEAIKETSNKVIVIIK